MIEVLLAEMPLRDVRPDVITYSTAVLMCEKGLHWQWALTLLNEMHGSGVVPNASIYNAIISACGKCHHWARSIELLAEMRLRGLRPDETSYSASINACKKGTICVCKHDTFAEPVVQLQALMVSVHSAAFSSEVFKSATF